jgi:hypothetical protein
MDEQNLYKPPLWMRLFLLLIWLVMVSLVVRLWYDLFQDGLLSIQIGLLIFVILLTAMVGLISFAVVSFWRGEI